MKLARQSSLTRAVTLALALVPLSSGHAHAAPLTVEEALGRAIKRSPDLQAALAELESARLGVLGAERQRDWVFGASLQGQYAEQFSDTSEGATRNSTQSIQGEASVRTTTDAATAIKVGLATSSRWQRVNRDIGTASEVVLGPTIAAQVTLDVTQPLLRGGGEDAVLAGVRQARSAEQVAQLARDRGASQVAFDLMGAYWSLWVAEQSLMVERAGYAVTNQQLVDMKKRSTLGTVPDSDVLRLASQEAARRQSLVAAEALVIERQFALAQMLGLPMTEAGALSAASSPAMPTHRGTPDDLIALAGAASYELLELAAQLALARDRVRVAADSAQSRLDLWANLGAGGLWTEAPPAGLNLPGSRPAFVVLVGLDFELPLSASSADAAYAQARAAQRVAELRYQSRQEALAAEIATLYRSLLTAETLAQGAAETASLASQLAEKEGQRLALGQALVSEVISAQQILREAELARLRALADVVLAGLALDQATGQLLTRLAVSMPKRTTR